MFQPSRVVGTSGILRRLYPMPEREQIKKPTTTRTEEEVVEETPASNKQGEKIKAELDELLDEIDEVLEENAEDFVRSYVQKGGE
jgi:ubiquitin-like protein Pup